MLPARERWSRPFLAAALALGLAAGSALARSAPGPHWYEAMVLDGMLSASDSYDLNHPASGRNQYRVFDFDDNSLKVDVLELVLQRAPARAGEVGFRVDLAAGSSIPRVSAAGGLFREEDGNAGDFDLQQAYASALVGIGRGFRVDVGKYCTSMGYEGIEGYDGFNDNASRSFVFGFAVRARTPACG